MKTTVCGSTVSIVLLIMAAIASANAQQCTNSITMCGCVVTVPGVYTVDADLDAVQGLTSRQGCIDVASSRVIIITNSHFITGAETGTGIGIHLLSSAEDVFLEGAQAAFSCSMLTGWQYALESEARNVTSDCFSYDNNTTGVLLKRARNNNINDFDATENSVYGIWIKGGLRNQINSSTTGGNGIAGIYLGCSDTGPSGKVCNGDEDEDQERSRGNFIYNHSTGSSPSRENYGVAVERGSRGNIIMDTSDFGNFVYDLSDGNPNCDGNLWHSNSFTTANQACIH